MPKRTKDTDAWKKHTGTFISAGGDIAVETMTVVEAKAKAQQMPDCKGFTYSGAESRGKVLIRFKNKFETGKGDWTTYELMKDAWKKHTGTFISAGGDIAVETMTITDAKAKAQQMPGCKGFTHSGAESRGPVPIHFKNKFETGKGDWTTYELLLHIEEPNAKKPKKDHDVVRRRPAASGYAKRGLVGGLPGAPDGIPIMCFPCVPDKAAERANYVVYRMLKDGDQGAVRRMCKCKCSVGIIGTGQVGSDLPPHAFLKGKTTLDGRSYDDATRGVGGTKHVPLTSVGEENVTMAPGDRYSQESILVHEFGHSVMNLGFNDKQMQRISKAYQSAMLAGNSSGLYMYSNKEEFWANGTQAWFNAIARTDVNNGITTRKKLREAHPDLARLMEEVYGKGNWRYTKDCPNPGLWGC